MELQHVLVFVVLMLIGKELQGKIVYCGLVDTDVHFPVFSSSSNQSSLEYWGNLWMALPVGL